MTFLEISISKISNRERFLIDSQVLGIFHLKPIRHPFFSETASALPKCSQKRVSNQSHKSEYNYSNSSFPSVKWKFLRSCTVPKTQKSRFPKK